MWGDNWKAPIRWNQDTQDSEYANDCEVVKSSFMHLTAKCILIVCQLPTRQNSTSGKIITPRGPKLVSLNLLLDGIMTS